MEKNKFFKVIIVFLLILNLGTLIFLFLGRGGGGNHHRDGGHHEGPGQFIVRELNFDKQQENKFEDLKKEHQEIMHGLMDSMKIQRDLLPEVIIDGNDAKADSVATKISGYQKQIEMATYQHFVKVYQICNEDQKKRFKNIIDDILMMMGPKKGGPPHKR